MIVKNLRFLLLSAVLCCAVFAIVVANSQNKSKITTETYWTIPTRNTRPAFVLVGDPVPGGGTPRGTNQTLNETC